MTIFRMILAAGMALFGGVLVEGAKAGGTMTAMHMATAVQPR